MTEISAENIVLIDMSEEEMREERRRKEEYEKKLAEQLFKFHMSNPSEQAWLNSADYERLV